MSGFKPYPAYKNSGCDRLGEVPAHWEVVPCRAIVDECVEKNDLVKVTEYLSLMANIGIIRYEDKGDVGNKKPDDLSKCKIVKKGDLVINSMNYGIGSYGLSPLDGICSPVYIVLDPRDNVIQERFALRIFEEKEFQAFAQSFGNGILAHRSAIGWDDLKNILVALPPLPEQTLLSNFLDHETARIDALIEEQQRLIELLKEKRQAVISHAVTKGLDPTVPMKDSGVEWLGEVPAHWEVTQVKRRCDLITDGAHISPETENGVYCFVSTRDVSDEGIDFERCLRTSADSYEYLVKTGCQPEVGDVLFSKDGTIGRTIVVGERLPDFVVASSLIIIRPSKAELLPAYLDFLCQSRVVSQQVEGFVKGAGLPRLSIQNLTKVIGVFPPFEEQVLIADFLQLQCASARQLSSEALRTMELLKERRSALISAAVTGKIDVRGWQPPASAQAPTLAAAEAH